MDQGNKYKKKKKHKKGWSCSFCSTQQAFIKHRRKYSAKEARTQETLAAKHLCETEPGPENLGVTSPLPRGFPLHSCSPPLLLRISVSGFHMHCNEDGTVFEGLHHTSL